MFSFTTINNLHEQLRAGNIQSTALLAQYLQRIEENKELNAFTEIYTTSATQKAIELDEKLNAGKALKKLHGVIIAIKDVICFKDHKVTAASAILENFTSLYTATALQFLIDEDAIIIGSCNCDEFAMGSSNENSYYGKVLNGLNKNKVPGGSSGGSAVAVQMDMCMLSLGSDTGGSVRQPADFCGIMGLKPGYGTVSRYGLLAYASSFDQIGIFGKTVEDVALLLQIMAQPDAMDSTMNTQKNLLDFKQGTEKKYKIAFIKQTIESEVTDIEIATKTKILQQDLQNSGHKTETINFDLLDYVVPAYYVLTTAEASSNLGRYDGVRFGKRSTVDVEDLNDFYINNRSEGFGWEVKRRIMLGTFVLSAGYYDAYYAKAQKIRRLLVEKVQAIFKNFDAIIMPVSPSTAFDIGFSETDPVAIYMADIFTVFANLTGLPAMAVPLFSHSNNMPFGVQVITGRQQEVLLLEVADLLTRLYK